MTEEIPNYSTVATIKECHNYLEYNCHMLVINPDDEEYRLNCIRGLLNQIKLLREKKRFKNNV